VFFFPQHDRFVELFVRPQDRTYAYVATLLPNRADAEQIFQQTSLIRWEKWQQFNPSRDFVRWACGMAHHEVCNFLHKYADKRRVYLSDDVLAELAQARLDAHDLFEARCHALLECPERLKRSKHELLEWSYGKYNIKTIASGLGQRFNVVYMILQRLRRILFHCIKRTLAERMACANAGNKLCSRTRNCGPWWRRWPRALRQPNITRG